MNITAPKLNTNYTSYGDSISGHLNRLSSIQADRLAREKQALMDTQAQFNNDMATKNYNLNRDKFDAETQSTLDKKANMKSMYDAGVSAGRIDTSLFPNADIWTIGGGKYNEVKTNSYKTGTDANGNTVEYTLNPDGKVIGNRVLNYKEIDNTFKTKYAPNSGKIYYTDKYGKAFTSDGKVIQDMNAFDTKPVEPNKFTIDTDLNGNRLVIEKDPQGKPVGASMYEQKPIDDLKVIDAVNAMLSNFENEGDVKNTFTDKQKKVMQNSLSAYIRSNYKDIDSIIKDAEIYTNNTFGSRASAVDKFAGLKYNDASAWGAENAPFFSSLFGRNNKGFDSTEKTDRIYKTLNKFLNNKGQLTDEEKRDIQIFMDKKSIDSLVNEAIRLNKANQGGN